MMAMLKENIERAEALAGERDMIAKKEKEILSQLELIDKLKESLDVAILCKEQELEDLYNTDKASMKAYSNQEKRNAKALSEPAIAKQKYDLKTMTHNLDILRIESRCELDKWKIQLELIRHW